MNDIIYLNIPKYLKIGYRDKKDPLCYMTYLKPDGKIAKETSWDNWRNKNIKPMDFENIPVTGLKIYEGIGGYSYSKRKTYCQIQDPRGFEIQIDFENLMFILHHHNIIANPDNGYSGIIGEFVYAWDGASLVLLSTESDDYKFSKNIDENPVYDPKDCEVGCTYTIPKYNGSPCDVIYLGYVPCNLSDFKFIHTDLYVHTPSTYIVTPKISKRHLFRKAYSNNPHHDFITYSGTITNKLSKCNIDKISDDKVKDYITEYNLSISHSENIPTHKFNEITGFDVYAAYEDMTDYIRAYTDNYNNIKDLPYIMADFVPKSETIVFIPENKQTVYLLYLYIKDNERNNPTGTLYYNGGATYTINDDKKSIKYVCKLPGNIESILKQPGRFLKYRNYFGTLQQMAFIVDNNITYKMIGD